MAFVQSSHQAAKSINLCVCVLLYFGQINDDNDDDDMMVMIKLWPNGTIQIYNYYHEVLQQLLVVLISSKTWTCVNVRMAHYSGLYDIQTLAMLSCVFASSKRRATSNLESSPRADRSRVLSHNPTTTTTDLTPTNVMSLFYSIFLFIFLFIYWRTYLLTYFEHLLRHDCSPPLSPSSPVVLNHISSHFLIPLSDSSLICTVPTQWLFIWTL